MEGDHELQAVAQEDGDPVAGAHAVVDEVRGEPVALLIELRVGERAVAEDDGRPVAALARPVPQVRGDRELAERIADLAGHVGRPGLRAAGAQVG